MCFNLVPDFFRCCSTPTLLEKLVPLGNFYHAEYLQSLWNGLDDHRLRWPVSCEPFLAKALAFVCSAINSNGYQFDLGVAFIHLFLANSVSKRNANCVWLTLAVYCG